MAVEIGVGVAIPIFVVLLRLLLTPIAGDRAPYAFVFAGIVVACVLAGWRSGLIALVVGQALAWYFIVAAVSPAPNPDQARLGGLIVATVAELLILIVIALYQREVDRAWSSQEREMHLLGDALQEIDHRTKNNYQTVLALVRLQAQRAINADVKLALQQVADRIMAVSTATEHLALQSEDLGTVRLGEHLRELCGQVERGLSREGIRLECELAEVSTSAEKAICISIIVNELVTNALKHAFDAVPDGVIRIESRGTANGFELIVADNGAGMTKRVSSNRGGLGSRLIDSFVKQLGAVHEIQSAPTGTTHRLLVPSLE